jgi:hypothetical protein
MSHIRGLHETGGLRSLRTVGSGLQRGKLTATLSRLDHQRTLLARQLAVWTEKQQVTAHRLALLDKEIEQLGHLIGEFGGPHDAAKPRKRLCASKSRQLADDGAVAAQRGNVSLEY